MTAETIHTCSYSCERPECIRAQRDELAARLTAPPSAPVGVEGLAMLLERIRDLLASLPVDCLGSGTGASGQPYPIRDEVIHGITKALAQQPAAVDEAYPTPRNRAEAVALARLALAHLGVIDAHIDAAIARCETDLAAQPQGDK